MLNNQIRINPALQGGSGNNSNKNGMKANDNASGKHKLNQYFDNYTDTTQTNFYL